MSWNPWPTDDYKGLARYVVKDESVKVAQLYLPDVSPFDAHQKGADGRRRLVEALYEGLRQRERTIHYNYEPFHWHDRQQLIRTPQQILVSPGEGTCLDLSLLFCGLCLQYELIPVLILIDDDQQHVLVAVSLEHSLKEWDSFSRGQFEETGMLADPVVMANLVETNKYIAVECTGFASTETPLTGPEGQNRENGFLSFETAEAVGLTQIKTRNMIAALDIYRIQHEFGYEPYELGEMVTMNPQELAAAVIEGLVGHPQTSALFDTVEAALADNGLARASLAELKKDPDQLADVQNLLVKRLVDKLEEDPDLAQKLATLVEDGSGTTISVDSGAAAVGDGATAVGERGVNVGGDVGGSIVTGSFNIAADLVEGDKVGGDKVGGDKVGGDKITVGNISGTGIAIGRGSSARVESGDTFNMSGDFRGAILNIKSSLSGVVQAINQIPSGNEPTKQELAALVKQLEDLFTRVPQSHIEEAEAVALTTKSLIDLAAAAKPNKPMLRITGDGLLTAAQNLTPVMPEVKDITSGIVAKVTTLTN